jgi:hypothetical protein
MSQTVEYLAVTQAHVRADRESARIGAEAAREAYTAAYDFDERTYDPEARDRALTKAENAAERAREAAVSKAWQPLYDAYLREEYAKHAPQQQTRAADRENGVAYYREGAGELSQRSERRY